MTERLSDPAREFLTAMPPQIPATAALELVYLHEIGRARDPVPTVLNALRRETGLTVADASSAELYEAAASLTWTRDPFDRLIAAHAIVADAPLVTADQRILEHLPQAVWD
jgi:PIN domain nuclease of toxin-antitoxin system